MKRIILALLAAWMLNSLFFHSSAGAQLPAGHTSVGTNKATVNPDALREMLVNGLKATRDDEKAYIDGVVERVVNKTLSASIVYAAFKYARTRRPTYPFPYFVYSVETLEKRQRNR